ncbi:GtrA family protein [Polaromonas sp. OV174]|uniref:GtrA family protein n=1 Tax=Polaromonas sp. OV174 TaxID=1855300 RepID=UPI003514CB1A
MSRLFRFVLVGVMGTIIYYTALWSLVEITRVPVTISSCIAFLLVAAENYLLHYLWTFRSKKPHNKTFPRFLLMNAMGFLLNGSVMIIGVAHYKFNYLWVQAVAIAVVVLWNFFLGSYWVFRCNRGSMIASSLGE